MPALVATRRLFTDSPAFGVYLIAVALLPFRWLSPLDSFYENSQWTDVLVAVAAFLWLIERVRERDLARAFRWWQVPLAVYLALSCASAAAEVPGFGGSWKTVLLMTELAVLATITADFAAEPARRRLIARVIVASALATVALGALALVLFYAGAETGLTGHYGEQLTPSDLYTRVRAGFDSPPLLASFCIFASGVAASRDAGLAPRLRVPMQVSLALLCLVTVSRAIVGFLFAVVLRASVAMPGRRRVVVPIAAAAVCLAFLAALSVGRLHLDPGYPSASTYVVPDPGNRREAFTTSLQTLGDHPLLGVGPGALPGLNRGLPFRAHFTPLNVAATLGIPALLALSAMFVLLWTGRRRPTDIALWSALAGMALDGLVGDVDHYRHLWILIGLLGAARNRGRTFDLRGRGPALPRDGGPNARFLQILRFFSQPEAESLPLPPVHLSLPPWPRRTSLPGPPLSLSLPRPPQITSLPARPLSLSLPPRPTITSRPGAPVSTSLRAVPTMVARWPLQVGQVERTESCVSSPRPSLSQSGSRIADTSSWPGSSPIGDPDSPGRMSPSATTS